MGLVLGISDYVVVLEFGKVIAQARPTSSARDPQVIAAYLGSAASELEPLAERVMSATRCSPSRASPPATTGRLSSASST